MKKLIFLSFLMLTAVGMQAQTTPQGEDSKVIEMRQRSASTILFLTMTSRNPMPG